MTTPVNSKAPTTAIDGTTPEINMNQVSPRVKEKVSLFQQIGGDKQKIDRKDEYEALEAFYKENEKDLNNSEKLYLQKLKDDYCIEVKKKEEEEYQKSITDYVKHAVTQIMGIDNEKTKIDSNLEIDLLIKIRDNQYGDLNAADIRYINEILGNVDPKFTRPEENCDGGKNTPDNNGGWQPPYRFGYTG